MFRQRKKKKKTKNLVKNRTKSTSKQMFFSEKFPAMLTATLWILKCSIRLSPMTKETNRRHENDDSDKNKKHRTNQGQDIYISCNKEMKNTQQTWRHKINEHNKMRCFKQKHKKNSQKYSRSVTSTRKYLNYSCLLIILCNTIKKSKENSYHASENCAMYWQHRDLRRAANRSMCNNQVKSSVCLRFERLAATLAKSKSVLFSSATWRETERRQKTNTK